MKTYRQYKKCEEPNVQDYVHRLYDVSLSPSGMAIKIKSFIKSFHVTVAGLMDEQLICPVMKS